MTTQDHTEKFAADWEESEANGEADSAGGSEWRFAIAAEICTHFGAESSFENLDWVEKWLWYVQRIEQNHG